MSADWRVVTIDELKSNDKGAIAIGPFGSRMKSDCYVANGIPVIRGTNITGGPSFEGEFVFITRDKADELGSCNVYKNDLVFPHRGSIGQVGIILSDERYVISSSLMKLTCDQKKANPRFLYYFFKSKHGRHELLKNASQVGTPGIGQPLASLRSISLNLPPLETQNRISDVLTSLDQKIHLNTQTNQTLESIAQAIFKSWFVDFDPVKAKIAAKERWYAMQPTSEPASPVCYAAEAALPDLETYTNLAAMCAISGKNETELAQLQQQNPDQYQQLADTAALFPSAMVDSELGEIPEGWEVSEIGNEVEIVGGGTPSTSEPTFWDDGEIHWTTPKDLSNNKSKVLLDTERKITEAGLSKISSGLLPKNTVLMSSRAPVGYLALAKVPVAINQGYIGMKCIFGLSPEFIILWAESVMEEIQQRASGTTFAEISKKTFRSIPLVKPAQEVVNQFTFKVGVIFDQIASNEMQTRTLVGIRDGLLPRLLSGEISLSAE